MEYEEFSLKLESFPSHKVILSDRSSFLDTNKLVNNMTFLPIMLKIGYPVYFGATHSIKLQLILKNQILWYLLSLQRNGKNI